MWTELWNEALWLRWRSDWNTDVSVNRHKDPDEWKKEDAAVRFIEQVEGFITAKNRTSHQWEPDGGAENRMKVQTKELSTP